MYNVGIAIGHHLFYTNSGRRLLVFVNRWQIMMKLVDSVKVVLLPVFNQKVIICEFCFIGTIPLCGSQTWHVYPSFSCVLKIVWSVTLSANEWGDSVAQTLIIMRKKRPIKQRAQVWMSMVCTETQSIYNKKHVLEYVQQAEEQAVGRYLSSL